MAAPVRVAMIDDDSGLLEVLERRFQALGWDWAEHATAQAERDLVPL